MARNADYNYVWVPLDRSIVFDEKKANDFIDSLLGVDYGYEVLLTGLLDTLRENWPCRR